MPTESVLVFAGVEGPLPSINRNRAAAYNVRASAFHWPIRKYQPSGDSFDGWQKSIPPDRTRLVKSAAEAVRNNTRAVPKSILIKGRRSRLCIPRLIMRRMLHAARTKVNRYFCIGAVPGFVYAAGMNAEKTAWAAVMLISAVVLCGNGCSEKAGQGTYGTGKPLVIEPTVSVGQICKGMTVEQVISALGEPERRTSNSLEYPRLGLAVMPGPDGAIQVVMCGDVTGINGPFVKAFTGRTKEGIGMNSSREDVIKAYGEPTVSEKMRGGFESLQYKPLGMTFTLETGKVHHIIVRLTEPPQPDRTVTLEPAAAQTPQK